MTSIQAVDHADGRTVESVHRIVANLVAKGAALGWVQPPSFDEVRDLFDSLAPAVLGGDAAIRVAVRDGKIVGFGYWRRYLRPTHYPHADIEKIAVAQAAQGLGVGRLLTTALVDAARDAGIEQLTLDLRGDNTAALRLYESLGFQLYGRLDNFVAVGDRRYDKLFLAQTLQPKS